VGRLRQPASIVAIAPAAAEVYRTAPPPRPPAPLV
jgi:hypothetical protein